MPRAMADNGRTVFACIVSGIVVFPLSIVDIGHMPYALSTSFCNFIFGRDTLIRREARPALDAASIRRALDCARRLGGCAMSYRSTGLKVSIRLKGR